MQINNPDKRVEILKEFAQTQFPACPLLDYALQVEKITTSKVTQLSSHTSSDRAFVVSERFQPTAESIILCALCVAEAEFDSER